MAAGPLARLDAGPGARAIRADRRRARGAHKLIRRANLFGRQLFGARARAPSQAGRVTRARAGRDLLCLHMRPSKLFQAPFRRHIGRDRPAQRDGSIGGAQTSCRRASCGPIVARPRCAAMGPPFGVALINRPDRAAPGAHQLIDTRSHAAAIQPGRP